MSFGTLCHYVENRRPGRRSEEVDEPPHPSHLRCSRPTSDVTRSGVIRSATSTRPARSRPSLWRWTRSLVGMTSWRGSAYPRGSATRNRTLRTGRARTSAVLPAGAGGQSGEEPRPSRRPRRARTARSEGLTIGPSPIGMAGSSSTRDCSSDNGQTNYAATQTVTVRADLAATRLEDPRSHPVARRRRPPITERTHRGRSSRLRRLHMPRHQRRRYSFPNLARLASGWVATHPINAERAKRANSCATAHPPT